MKKLNDDDVAVAVAATCGKVASVGMLGATYVKVLTMMKL